MRVGTILLSQRFCDHYTTIFYFDSLEGIVKLSILSGIVVAGPASVVNSKDAWMTGSYHQPLPQGPRAVMPPGTLEETNEVTMFNM